MKTIESSFGVIGFSNVSGPSKNRADIFEGANNCLKQNHSLLMLQDNFKHSFVVNTESNPPFSSSYNLRKEIGNNLSDITLDSLLNDKKSSRERLFLKSEWNLSRTNLTISKRNLSKAKGHDDRNNFQSKRMSFGSETYDSGYFGYVTSKKNDKFDSIYTNLSSRRRSEGSLKSKTMKKLPVDPLSVIEKSMRLLARLKNNTGCPNRKTKSSLKGFSRLGQWRETYRTSKDLLDSQRHNISSSSDKDIRSIFHTARIKRKSNDPIVNHLNNIIADNSLLSHSFRENSGVGMEPEYCEESNPDLTEMVNASMKLKFPNSNWKREEKLRSINKGMCISKESSSQSKIAVSRNLILDGPQLDPPQEFNNMYSRQDHVPKLFTSSIRTDSSSIFTHSENNDNKPLSAFNGNFKPSNNVMTPSTYEKTESVNEVMMGKDTQTVLLYLSETLINSAQRAETLLMQKVKDYNDLVFKEMPKKYMVDFSCQTGKEVNHDEERNVRSEEQFKLELTYKDNKIKQLEGEKRKLKHIVKKATSDTLVKKVEHNVQQSEICIGAMDGFNVTNTTKLQESGSERTSEKSHELVQILQLENRLLRNLVKEMRSELEQENAVILNLAKKLEASLSRQTSIQKDTKVLKSATI